MEKEKENHRSDGYLLKNIIEKTLYDMIII